MSDEDLRAYAFGAGTVVLGPDGAVKSVGHPTRGHSMLLEEDGDPVERLMHDADHRWGKGFVVSDHGSHRWDHARSMISFGDDLPAHEVNYEQSMVAPLLDLLLAARRIDSSAVADADLVRRLAWLEAFAGDQPDVRMRDVSIRHWDGYWFGGLRLWGDVFPHYWSCLSAAAYVAWPDDVAGPDRAAELHARGRTILRANLASFSDDGSATCAFVYPSCVDGRPAHVADPLANDQDWALVYALRLGLSA